MDGTTETLPDLVSLVEQPEWKSILLDLVRSERMDPWDIDVALLAQKYLERIHTMRENNLYVPANALLACAILLNLKADVLKQYYEALVEGGEDTEEEFVEDFAVAMDFFEEPEPVDADSKDYAPSKPEVLPPARITARRVSLDELLAAMEKVMKAKKSGKIKSPPPEPTGLDILMEEMDQEDVDLLVQEVEERVRSALDSEGLTTLSRIVQKDDVFDLVRTLLALLYLGNSGKLNIWQEAPFQEVFISVVDDGRERAESGEGN